MLAILFIEMMWYKQNRNPYAAIQRKPYYNPVRIEDGINLTENGVFLKKCSYFQEDKSVHSSWESADKSDKKMYMEGRGKPFASSEEHIQKLARLRNERMQKEKGAFYRLDEIDIPCIKIEEEQQGYRIKWFDYGCGMPRRRGGNADCFQKGAKLAGEPNVLNETAFVLETGKSGLLKYNYRYTSYHGQWYKCYYVYVVNERVLTQDIFIRKYDYEYNQLADLF